MNHNDKLRVLIISAAYTPDMGGVATHVANLAHGLKDTKRFRVYVFASAADAKPEVARPPYGHTDLLVWKEQVYDVPSFSGRRAPYQEILGRLLDRWDELNPDIIHAHDYDSVQIGAVLKAVFKKPLVVTLHRAPTAWRNGKEFESPKDAYQWAMKVYDYANILVVPSNASRKVALDQGFPENRVRVGLPRFDGHPGRCAG